MKNILLLLAIFSVYRAQSQSVHTIDASGIRMDVASGHLKMGDPGPAGKEIKINNRYMTLNGKPVIPIMGEMHYSRYPREQWEDAILKMKANGITIIACYVFWIHHEEIEGQFDWSGNKDLRYFTELCHKHGLWVYPRIGPWSHGEVRNGGTPDWIVQKKLVGDRSNEPSYQQYVDKLYKQVSLQLKGLLYKDGGPVVGIQLENEYRRGKGGEPHILWLKETAIRNGINVPMYTVTGWGPASVPQDEVIPLYGGYPEEPWVTHLGKLEENTNFVFEAPRSVESIGNEQGVKEKEGADNSRYPYFTCEIGIGNQLSEHRRPIINPIDGLAITISKIGSGSNLPGYYVFTGGLNPTGILTSMEENKEETGYWNEYPDISYDFQAAIRETGELAPSYFQVKKLHYFLNEFGSALAPMQPVLLPAQDPKKELLLAVRANETSGFLFGLNYYRDYMKGEKRNTQFNVKLKNGETILFPSRPVTIADSAVFIWPINFNLNGTVLKYATAQPLCKVDQKDRTDWFFVQHNKMESEFSFDAANIEKIEAVSGSVKQVGNQFIVTGVRAGIANVIKILNKDGSKRNVVLLSEQEAKQLWLLEQGEKKHVFLSDAALYLNDGRLHVSGLSNAMKIVVLSDATNFQENVPFLKRTSTVLHREYQVALPGKKLILDFKPYPVLGDAQWLNAGVAEITPKNQLWHRLFLKEFSLKNPSSIKSARMILATQATCKLQINSRWINQAIVQGRTNELDITGYVQSGENRFLLDVPFIKGDVALAARVIIEYFNTDRIEFTTDASWLTTDQYIIPAPWQGVRTLKAPEMATARKVGEELYTPRSQEWSISIPDKYLQDLNNVYLHINYTGDKGQCRFGHRLISDNFNNGTPWLIAFKALGDQLENQSLRVELFPLKQASPIRFDIEPAKEDIGKVLIKKLDVVPEYTTEIILQD